MANGDKDNVSKIPRWDERPGSLDDFQDKLRFFVLGTKKEDRYLCASRVIREMDPESLQYKICKKLDEDVLTAANGFDGMKAIVEKLRKQEGPKSIHQTVKLIRDVFTKVKREKGESMSNGRPGFVWTLRRWVRRLP